MKKTLVAAGALLILALIAVFLIFFYPLSAIGKAPQANQSIHVHADFLVYLEGQPYNFSQAKYMSNDSSKLDDFIHLHDGNGELMHKHKSGITLGEFFSSLGMKFNSSCFVLDNATAYCNSGQKTLKMYVNGTRNYDFEKYDFQDLDRILITYGSESDSEIAHQIASVPDRACIQSGKCPERGQPVGESSCLASNGLTCQGS